MIKRSLAYALMFMTLGGLAAKVGPAYFTARQIADDLTGVPQHQSTPVAGTKAGPRQLAVNADRSGHFFVEAVVNGRRVVFMVDTGATVVTLNEATARRLNLKTDNVTFGVGTANGSVEVSPATLQQIKIGRITVNNVEAVVIPGKGLETNLLGMSFLRKLRSFESHGDRLVLVQ